MNKNKCDKSNCILNNLRKATRVTSRYYDSTFKKLNLKSTQFSLLTVISIAPSSISVLAEKMEMDRTTLTRNLKPLESRGLINITSNNDMRVKCVSITSEGKQLMNNADKLWNEKQLALVDKIGKRTFNNLLSDLEKVRSVINELNH